MTTKVENVLQMRKPPGEAFVDAYAYAPRFDEAMMARDLREMRDAHPHWIWRIVRRETSVIETVVEGD